MTALLIILGIIVYFLIGTLITMGYIAIETKIYGGLDYDDKDIVIGLLIFWPIALGFVLIVAPFYGMYIFFMWFAEKLSEK